jgi:hypothetical protein
MPKQNRPTWTKRGVTASKTGKRGYRTEREWNAHQLADYEEQGRADALAERAAEKHAEMSQPVKPSRGAKSAS